MAAAEELTKRVAINKANGQMMIVLGVASFVTVFCLMASKALWSQNAYQARVIDASNTAQKQLASNISAYNQLTSSYESFVSQSTNVIGGQSSGGGDNGGNNSQIVLDSLPPAYDFPGLASTIDKILTTHNYDVTNITGTDDQISQQTNTSSPNPTPVPIPFSFTVSNTNYLGVAQLISALQTSIRPIAVDTLNVSGGGNNMTATVTAHTYYQPAKSLNITEQVVK